MTVEEESTNNTAGGFREKTLTNFMGGNRSSSINNAPNTPTTSSKKQTSLLSFFSSPSPKRPLIEDDSKSSIMPNVIMGSPLKKKTRDTSIATPLIASSSFYEMVSEEDDEGVPEVEMSLNTTKGNLPSHMAPSISSSAFNLKDFEYDESMMVDEVATDSTLLKCLKSAENNNNYNIGDADFARENNSAERYPWLVKIRDIDGRSPGLLHIIYDFIVDFVGDSDYDPRTLFIPKNAWQKFTPFEKQFWEIKCKLFDTVVFFKKGKFYELYENDADVGSRDFDLKMTERVNMRMVGVPEATFEMWAARFVSAGYKIARVDQTETAIGKTIREKDGHSEKGNVGKEDKIIRRELTCILTAGTVSEPSMLSSDSASYCLALKEKLSTNGEESPSFGAAIVDASTGIFHLSSFVDDSSRSILETMLMQLQPKEVLIEKGRLSISSRKVIKNLLPQALITEAISDREFWSRTKAADELDLGKYFANTQWPDLLKKAYVEEEMSFLAFGALFWYLRELKLERTLLSFKDNFVYFDPISSSECLVLDGQTLLNLDILPNTMRCSLSVSDPRKGTLLAVVDHCITPFGRRMMESWLCHPLRSLEPINARLDSVDFFLAEPGLCDRLNAKLKLLPDLERFLGRIHSGSIKLKDFISTIDAFKIILQIVDLLQMHNQELPLLCKSILQDIPSYTLQIEYFGTAFDREIALKEGTIVPYAGVEEDFDQADATLRQIEGNLQRYLREQETRLNIRGAKYKDMGKELFQLEIPVDTPVPKEYMLMSKTKNVKRYWTPEIKILVKEFQEGEERRAAILRSIYSRLLQKFDQMVDIWRLVVTCIGKFDCLLSLSKASSVMAEPKCRPYFISNSSMAICEMTDLRHPCVNDASFISNDLNLGEKERIILLTGPNMGGKSTLLRQTCLAVILAQLGCHVPASSCTLSPVDRIFTRLGANDNIIAGQSTFMVELLDAAKIMKEATSRSLVILDELGRGTSTFDGMAIAHAVLLYLARKVKCIGLFATHYRPVAVDFMQDTSVTCKYMSCHLDPLERRVTFLYKLANGVSPKSYGMNVAAMAGLPTPLIEDAERIAEEFDSTMSLSIESQRNLNTKSRQLSRRLIEAFLLSS